MKKYILLFITASLLLPSVPAKAELLNISEKTLDNGMRVVVIPNHKAPIAKHMVWYKVGASDEVLGKGGSAHLLEHLMFRGTSKVKGQEFNRIMEENGADSNAFTSQDFTVYHQFVDISRLELAMFLEADRMQNLKIDNKSFETERQIVYQERKQVVESNPLYRFNEEMQRAFWQQHPYSRPITGTEDEILSLTIDDVKAIYGRYYAPDNAILVIAGDIEPEKAFALADKYYGKIPAKGFVNNKKITEDSVKTSISLRMEMPQADIARFVRRYKAPAYNGGKDRIYAWMVLSKYLGEGETSQLYNRLVADKHDATAVSTSYNYTSTGGGSFVISAVPAQGKTAEYVREQIDIALAEAVKGITPAKIEKVKKQLLSGLVYIRDNPNDAAQIAGMLAAIGMSDEEIENYADKIKRITADDVRKIAQELLLSPATDGIVQPKGGKK
uniref:Peptidase M16 n=1 Tax=uncultured Alphaproteobacteria bacterium TaxID=91750 RepID=A0A6G8F3G6_9PROT|nr:peptidase M16 [uncultured Alphaproteobacteria bacterium]